MRNKKLLYIVLSSVLISFSLFLYLYFENKTQALRVAMVELNSNIREASRMRLKLKRFLAVERQIKLKKNTVRFQPVNIKGNFDSNRFVANLDRIINATYENGFFFLDSFSLERNKDNSSFSVSLKGKKVFIYGLK